MKLPRLARLLPGWKNAILALGSAVLLILAFPDFEYWFLAWFALVPLMWAVEREKESTARAFILGWIFGTVFFFGTCWWLTFAPITYAGFPPILAYLLFFFVAAVAGVFPGVFGAVLSVLLRRFGSVAILAAPFVWVCTEFLRYWITGNNWNALGYSQAWNENMLEWAGIGGIWLVSGIVALLNTVLGNFIYSSARVYANGIKGVFSNISAINRGDSPDLIDLGEGPSPTVVRNILVVWFGLVIIGFVYSLFVPHDIVPAKTSESPATVVALQPNVPMSGLTYAKWQELRLRHVRLAESALTTIDQNPQSAIRNPQSTVVIFPESPMNFEYESDRETQNFINSFAATHNVSVLFNSAEPDGAKGKFFNSAVLVGPGGKEVAQYDKIYLLPFGESVPYPLQSIVPAFVGSFSYGSEYDLLPLGDAKAGVMICFESHFGQLSREYVRNGADVIFEMTNDGYLGPTPVLRQHLANAVFRAVETNRPVLRVTNVGITAHINEKGEILDPSPAYQEDTRVWSVSKSDGGQTFYVRYGDWFAWLCSIVTVGLILLSFRTRRSI